MEQPLISVIVPVYNSEEYITQCLDSICAQTYKSLEIILIDDGSGDGSRDMCAQWEKRDSRIQVIFQEHRGVSAARNAGLDRAGGAYVAFADSDDWLEPDHIQKLAEAISGSQCSISGYISESETTSQRRSFEALSPCGPVAAAEMMLRPELYQGFVSNKLFLGPMIRREKLRFNESVCFLEDVLFCGEYFSRCSLISFTDSATYHYRQHSGSTIGSCDRTGEWLTRRLTCMKALDELRDLNMGGSVGALCAARRGTEYAEILGRLLCANADREMLRELKKQLGASLPAVMRSPLKLRFKVKCVLMYFSPGLTVRLRKNN